MEVNLLAIEKQKCNPDYRSKKASIEELLLSVMKYHYRHQTIFNNKKVTFNGACCCHDICTNTVTVIFSCNTNI